METHPVLLVTSDLARGRELVGMLEVLRVEPYFCLTVDEAELALARNNFLLVFSDVELADGDYCDVLRIREILRPRAAVVVTSRTENARAYLDAMRRGAFDFILWPYCPAELGRIVRGALGQPVHAVRAG
jgi:two-component system, response regulator FlrC